MTNLSKEAAGALGLIEAAKNYGKRQINVCSVLHTFSNGKGWVGETGREEEVGCGTLRRE